MISFLVQSSLSWLWRVRRLAVLALLSVATTTRAGDTILVVNSDASVEKYRLAAAAFAETWTGVVVQIDLADASVPAQKLRSKMRAADPAAVYCIGSKAYVAAHAVFKQERIILSSSINWERLPERSHLQVIANELPVESQATLFRYFFPKVNRVGVLCSRRFNREWLERAQREASSAGVEIVFRYVDRPWQSEDRLKELLPVVDALWIVADPIVLAGTDEIRRIFEVATEARKPVFAYSRAFAQFGATLVVAPDDATIGRQAAGMLTRPARSPDLEPLVEQPAGSEVILNIRMVEEYGLELNERALDSVNHVIR